MQKYERILSTLPVLLQAHQLFSQILDGVERNTPSGKQGDPIIDQEFANRIEPLVLAAHLLCIRVANELAERTDPSLHTIQ